MAFNGQSFLRNLLSNVSVIPALKCRAIFNASFRDANSRRRRMFKLHPEGAGARLLSDSPFGAGQSFAASLQMRAQNSFVPKFTALVYNERFFRLGADIEESLLRSGIEPLTMPHHQNAYAGSPTSRAS